MSNPNAGGTKVKALSRFRPFLPAALVVLGLFVGRIVDSPPWRQAYDFVDRVLFRALGGFPSAQDIAERALRVTTGELVAACGWVVFLGVFLVPLGFVARLVARSRVRAGAADPIQRLRSWMGAHPAPGRALLAMPSAIWTSVLLFMISRNIAHGTIDHTPLPVFLVPAVPAVAGIYAAARWAFRFLVAPTIDSTEATRIAISPDEIVFDAVAVTTETRAAVGALAAISVAMTAWIAVLPIATLYRDARLFAAVAGYIGLAAGSALLFRRASRVAVGVDGVRVAGTSRTRFFAYRDLDAARVNGGDLELVRRDRVVLRLQLHGADASRRDAVCARIRENIERVKLGKDAIAAQLVASASKDQLTRIASGGADYRAASVSREALWALIEGPAVDAASRKAAAEALATTSDEGERTRLRVAAERCADPKVRVALEELAEAEPREAIAVTGAPRARAL